MSRNPLRIEERSGTQPGQRVLVLTGPLILATACDFQATVRGDQSRCLIVDFTAVPYVDSAGIGAGASVTRQNCDRSLALVGVSERVRKALKITCVEQFFRFFDSVGAAEQATVV